jgi:hypothetical protein
VPANGSYRANVDPKSPRIRAACGCFSRGNPPRRRSGNRSSPTSCCAWKRRCTAAPAPRCATFVSLSRDGFFAMKNDGSFQLGGFTGVFHRARVFERLFDAKKSRVCDCRAEPPPEARATPRSRDARRRTRPRPASSGDAVGGSARGTRDRAANATRTNRLFVYAPPKPSTLRDDALYKRKDRSRRRAFSRAGCVGRTLRTLHARVRFTRITTLTDHISPLLDFHANANIRRVAGGVL